MTYLQKVVQYFHIVFTQLYTFFITEVDIYSLFSVNRNPPEGILPAGIVQSTQPFSSLEVFTNSKESALLTSLREEAKKKRI